MLEALKIENYILKEQIITDVKDFEAFPNNYCISISNYPEQAKEILVNIFEKYALEQDGSILRPDDLQGILHMTYNGVNVMKLNHWTDIIAIWSYFVSMINNYINGFYVYREGVVEWTYPEEPIPITLEKQIDSNNVNFTVDDVKISLDEKYFIQTVLSSAKEFFIFMQNVFNEEFFEARKYMLDSEYISLEDFEKYNFDKELKIINEMLEKINK
jgi:hypothetical protein